MDHHHPVPPAQPPSVPETPGGGMEMDMSMQWNWATRHFMVVFESWHVRTPLDFCLTVLTVYLLALGLERLYAARARIDHAMSTPERKRAASLQNHGHTHVHAATSTARRASPDGTDTAILIAGDELDGDRSHAVRSSSPAAPPALTSRALYWRTFLMAVTYFLSAFMMLVLMTFNGWLILAATAGAATGFHLFRSPGFLDLERHCD
ncbi:Ctr copper transporter [Blastocladiella britannica]|nr:Ctr copper transporter [Blastocladiella britannica]